jgi:putative adhesin
MRVAYGLGLSLLTALASTAVNAGDGTFDRQVAAQPRGAVDISNVSGRIEVTGWDRAEVSVHAELESGVERVDVSSERGHTIIKVVLAEHSHGGEAELRVQVPKDSEVNVSAVSADVTSQGVLGIQRLSAVSGDVTAEIAGSDVEARTVSGGIKLKGHGQPARLRVSTVSGDVHLEHGAGDFEGNTVSGTLTVSLDTARSVRWRSTSGDMRFTGKLTRDATFEASSVSGDLGVRASADGGYEYEVSSFSGDISDCFNVHSERTSKYGPGSRLQGSLGQGAGHMRLKTMSGDIQLCDRS